MITSREKLELCSLYIGVGLNDARFNYLYVDKEFLVSYNLEAMAKIKHYGVVDAPFYISKSTVDLALKQTKAKSFELFKGSIRCFDKDGYELFTISSLNEILGKFINTEKGLKFKDSDKAIKTKFVDANYLKGIFATKNILVKDKLLPKKLSPDFQGYVSVTNGKEPILISSKNCDVALYIVPTFNNYLFSEDN